MSLKYSLRKLKTLLSASINNQMPMLKSDYNKHLYKYKDLHAGQSAIIFATGPSIEDYKKFSESKNFIKIGLNRIYNYPQILDVLDYYFFGSHYYIDDDHKRKIDRLCGETNIVTLASCYEEGMKISIIFC